MEKLKVGDEVYWVNWNNRIHPFKYTKINYVGKKYFTIEDDSDNYLLKDIKFGSESCRSSNSFVFISKKHYENECVRKTIVEYIEKKLETTHYQKILKIKEIVDENRTN